MERDRDTSGTPGTLERQIERLAPQLREKGIAPERDLWPGIAAEIARREPSRRRGGGPQLWRIAALAASLLLLLGVGWVQWQGWRPEGPEAAPRAALPAPAATDDVTAAGAAGGPADKLEAARTLLDDALERLDEARSLDPGSAGLTRLMVMIQESRGDLIRDAAKRLDLPGS